MILALVEGRDIPTDLIAEKRGDLELSGHRRRGGEKNGCQYQSLDGILQIGISLAASAAGVNFDGLVGFSLIFAAARKSVST